MNILYAQTTTGATGWYYNGYFWHVRHPCAGTLCMQLGRPTYIANAKTLPNASKHITPDITSRLKEA